MLTCPIKKKKNCANLFDPHKISFESHPTCKSQVTRPSSKTEPILLTFESLKIQKEPHNPQQIGYRISFPRDKKEDGDPILSRGLEHRVHRGHYVVELSQLAIRVQSHITFLHSLAQSKGSEVLGSKYVNVR